SGVNNAVARAASLLAVAVLPLAVSLRGDDYQHAERLAAGFRLAMQLCAGLLAGGAVLAVVSIRRPDESPPASRRHCAIAGPPLHERLRRVE
ncbi:MAG TPA: hypothetical protein VFB62_13980, partial [Polyangiaceae bacterium]|nr:hypothetical protein [Polyangiaceae bacterium]